MKMPQTVHLLFTCPHCASANELTAAHLHEATVIHCSHCGTAVAALGALRHQFEHQPLLGLRRAG